MGRKPQPRVHQALHQRISVQRILPVEELNPLSLRRFPFCAAVRALMLVDAARSLAPGTWLAVYCPIDGQNRQRRRQRE